MDRPDWAPLGIDLTRPSASRIYDYYLGGSHNFEVDRVIARQAIETWPELPSIMQGNRRFLRRAVRFMIDAGITQFIDIGSGIPTAGNVHEVARLADPATRVVYVDNDPVAVTHSRAILGDDTQTAVVQADLHKPDDIVHSPDVTALIDFTKPVGILLVAVLHFVQDSDDPARLVADLADRVASGSYLAISHATSAFDPVRSAELEELYRRTPTPLTMRKPTQVASFFGPFELVAPGLIEISQWRPDNDNAVRADEPGHAGVGRKR